MPYGINAWAGGFLVLEVERLGLYFVRKKLPLLARAWGL